MAGRLPTLVPRDDREEIVLAEWRESGLLPGTMAVYAVWVRRFRAHCRAHGLDEIASLTLADVMSFARAYKGARKGMKVKASSRIGARQAVHAWACTLRRLGEAVPPWQPASPERSGRRPDLLARFADYRRNHRGVAPATVQRDIAVASAFLRHLRSRSRCISRIRVVDIDTFVEALTARLARRTVAGLCSALRGFLRFLRTIGRLQQDLAKLVLAPRYSVAEKPPRALPWSDVRCILRSVPRDSRIGRRDYAMLLLMATLGMGAAEVIGLRLDDIDWRASVLRARRPKTSVPIELPLLPNVARAMAAYLKQSRPRSTSRREVFLTMKMPFRPLSSSVLRHRVREYARRGGVQASVLGSHLFRRSHATRQIDSGVDLQVVSDILGHRRPSSTSTYVRVALRRLRMVALPVPR